MDLIEESKVRLGNISMPSYYDQYHNDLLNQVSRLYNLAQKARERGLDVTNHVEPKIAYDLSDRVAKMHNIDISDRLRALLNVTSKEKAALKIAEEIATGEYGSGDLRMRLENAVRVSLAVVTEGVTVAPLQGISDVQIKNNKDGTQYLSISFAGPIRSAGGTEAALTMLIADHVRQVVGLSKYQTNSFDDETGRFIEELRLYEREVGNFQFKVLDKDVDYCISNLPVEIDGVDTDPVELVIHREMKRIKTDRVRGGALRVMNDGLIGRCRKLMKLVESLGLEGWNWLANLNGAIQTGDDDTVSHRMSEVITGRPVLSMSKKIGGFRLRYGRCFNTGFATVGIHKTIPILLNSAIVVGTQIKMDVPGKASTIALVDTIEPPIVKLDDGTVLQINTIEQALNLRPRVVKILFLGDILISYGDFLENNAQLLPASYVEEIWSQELFERVKNFNTSKVMLSFAKGRLSELSTHPSIIPLFIEALKISVIFDVPLHPKYSFYWEAISIKDFLYVRNALLYFISSYKVGANQDSNNKQIEIIQDHKLKSIFEKIGVFHKMNSSTNTIIFQDESQILALLCLCIPEFQQTFLSLYDTNDTIPFSVLFDNLQKNRIKQNLESMIKNLMTEKGEAKLNVIKLINSISVIQIRSKFSSSISVRVGRPEKAAERKMKPPIHVLFPVGNKGGPMRDLIKASNTDSFYSEKSNRFCYNCNIPSLGTNCNHCNQPTPIKHFCKVCKIESLDLDIDNLAISKTRNKCLKCGNEYKTFSPIKFPLKTLMARAEAKLGVRIDPPLKGVKSLMGKDKEAEQIEKGILRQKCGLSVFKDGTIRFDATNEPLTHFMPSFIKTSISRLRDLGYVLDYKNIEVTSDKQIIELLIQDVIIPLDSAKYLLKTAKFIDEEMVSLYNLPPVYNAYDESDLIGHLIVGLAPHTSVGIIGRIIGYTESQVCLGSPVWHSAKRRDCDGDADSIILLFDAFLNFSYSYLPDKIGGLMDAPLLIQPIVLPHEVQRQAHNIDVVGKYPLNFYQKTWSEVKASEVSDSIEILKNRIGTNKQFYDYGFTHLSSVLISDVNRSAYSTLNTMTEKLEMQIATANLINSVDTNEVISMVLTTHIIPDIMGNMRSYSSQAFRCNKCGEKYRRMPLYGRCLVCDNSLLQTVTRGSVEKYVLLAENMCNNFKVTNYLKSRVESLIVELNFIFQSKQIQPTLLDYL
ncbi:MAG: DNA polymerase II large subunit [Candidatus Nitrosocosmicus sp.]|jgi:DNA polymerase II large subunit|uniref:DNA polymerase II large subunit n=1 Tax=Candidatus Nitrosocosmicus agrestis TaxID=2563600 RepID=UPI00122DCC9C|nr:DNA polymerase II large subunit [Candidatus Nitrosocosmicus sp. SS]KAA2282838.1 DNA polymerase II large subunit [Candidatus Nitrosocosmicus sp. SS]KAF0869040.1 DNA polymerase II large subunit [Candidatus Nitrosocosmicus sp. SS]MDR4489615.1 DNA polymerase II large subunit [Candidatus Nitrosocosmicus sp.]